MEPSTPERKIVLVQPTEPVALADTAMIPEVLAGFTESILIDDDDETELVTGIPSASGVAETSVLNHSVQPRRRLPQHVIQRRS